MGSFYQAHRSCIQSTEIKYSTFVRQALLQRKRWPESRNLSFFPQPQPQIHLQILLLLCSSDCSEPRYGRGRSWAHQELHTPGFILLGDHPLLPGRFKRIPSKALSLLPPTPSRASPRLQLPRWSREKPQGAKPPGTGRKEEFSGRIWWPGSWCSALHEDLWPPQGHPRELRCPLVLQGSVFGRGTRVAAPRGSCLSWLSRSLLPLVGSELGTAGRDGIPRQAGKRDGESPV